MPVAAGRGSALRRAWWLLMLLALSLLALVPAAQAQVVIYRCTDATGAVTLQNGTPCPKGSKEVKRVVEPAPQQSRAQFIAGGAVAPAPASAPAAQAAPAGMTAPVAPAPTAAPAPVPAAEATATPAQAGPAGPPALFECRTWEGHRYLGDEAAPPPRCVPLAVSGLDGTVATGGASACQMVHDDCQPVPDTMLCEGWSRRLDDVESQSVGGGDNRAYAQAEASRLRGIIAASSCAKP